MVILGQSVLLLGKPPGGSLPVLLVYIISPVTDNLVLLESVEEGKIFHKRICQMQGSFLGPLAYEADTIK